VESRWKIGYKAKTLKPHLTSVHLDELAICAQLRCYASAVNLVCSNYVFILNEMTVFPRRRPSIFSQPFHMKNVLKARHIAVAPVVASVV